MNISIIGAGNMGLSIATGLVKSKKFMPSNIILTNKKFSIIENYKNYGFMLEKNNIEAIKRSDIIILAIEPKHLDEVLEEISKELNSEKHLLLSIVLGVTTQYISEKVNKDLELIRVMPNTAIAAQESMTCLASSNATKKSIEMANEIFGALGKTMVIDEESMGGATALTASGIAFFLRILRAASEAGVELGFSADEALKMVSQTAKGAATLLEKEENHPEIEIDKVTTPKGCTIRGLNKMEEEGLSSSMINGILETALKASGSKK